LREACVRMSAADVRNDQQFKIGHPSRSRE